MDEETGTRAVGFYVTVRDGSRAGFLLGPYPAHDAALDNVDRVRRYAEERAPEACFYSFGTAKATAKPGRELKPGRLNEVLGLTADV